LDDRTFDLWEQQARSTYKKIYYDQWLIDKTYRDSIAEEMNMLNLDIINDLSSAGGGSSFIGMRLDSRENLLTRYQQIEIPDDLKEKIIYYSKRNPEYSVNQTF